MITEARVFMVDQRPVRHFEKYIVLETVAVFAVVLACLAVMVLA